MKDIAWKETLIINIVRSACAGLVWASLIGFTAANVPATVAIVIAIFFPAIYLVFYLPLGLICTFLNNKGVPFVGWLALALGVMILAGDPITFILHKVAPKIVPVENYRLVNLALVLYVKKNSNQLLVN